MATRALGRLGTERTSGLWVHMGEISKTRAVRAIVRPDQRAEYLERWKVYAKAVTELGASVCLYEDQVLPGRFLELTEFRMIRGKEAELRKAIQAADLKSSCVRREGDDVVYREVVPTA